MNRMKPNQSATASLEQISESTDQCSNELKAMCQWHNEKMGQSNPVQCVDESKSQRFQKKEATIFVHLYQDYDEC